MEIKFYFLQCSRHFFLEKFMIVQFSPLIIYSCKYHIVTNINAMFDRVLYSDSFNFLGSAIFLVLESNAETQNKKLSRDGE